MLILEILGCTSRFTLKRLYIPKYNKHFLKRSGFNNFEAIGGIRAFGGINLWNEDFSHNIRVEIEKYWAGKVEETRFDENSNKEKFYILSMFPYPSGFLHMGHLRVYGISDVLARYFRMKGKNVFHPMGWDAFGLPAENAAIEKSVPPNKWTQTNIAHMKSLMEEMNFSFDWDREFATCDSDYYKWTQFFFLKLYEQGMVYRKDAFVNWDPIDKTVLAEEQIDENGHSWRSGAVVEKKIMRQWFVNTTKYAESLAQGLKDPSLKNWKDVIDIQQHWIGEVNGVSLNFKIVDDIKGYEGRVMSIWTKYPEYIDKVKFVAVKPDSFWAFGCEGIGLVPYKAKNPLTGDIIPVYISDTVEFPEGADTYLGVPAINENDRKFADLYKISYCGDLPHPANEEELKDFRKKICSEAREKGVGGFPTSSKLKDWLISRQRYWGTPIPIIYCETCGEQPVPEKDLPVRLPEVKCIQKGDNPLKKETDWFNTNCPKCGGPAVRETDTMDTFVDSSWYYLRYLDPDNEDAAFDIEKIKKMMPVDIYIGGKEHALLHLYYARFMNHFLYSVGLVPSAEPFKELLCQGMVKGLTYKNIKTGAYVKSDLVEMRDGNPFNKENGEPLVLMWEKMSKSKHNSVDPRTLLEEHGIDTTRLVILSGPSPKSDVLWCEKRFRDLFIWQRRLWLTVKHFIKLRSKNLVEPKKTEEYQKLDFYIFDSRNFYLNKVTSLIENSFDVATAISKLQSFTNSLRKCNDDVVTFSLQFERALALQIILLAPMAPYFASELWSGFLKAPNRLCNTGEILWDRSVFEQPWPLPDPNYQSQSEEILDMLNLKSKKSKTQQKKKVLKKLQINSSPENENGVSLKKLKS